MNDPVPLPPPPAAWGSGTPGGQPQPWVRPGALPAPDDTQWMRPAQQPAGTGYPAQPYPAQPYPGQPYPGHGHAPGPAQFQGHGFAPGQFQGPGHAPGQFQGAGYTPGPGRPPGYGIRPSPGAMPPGYPPVPPRRRRRAPIVATAAVLVVLLALCGGTAVGLALRPAASDAAVGVFVDPRPEARDVALRALLERRATAVREKDKKAFLADVDATDRVLVARQGLLYDNLVKLSLAEFSYEIEPAVAFDDLVPSSVRQRHPRHVRAPGVTLRYRVDGLDTEPLAVPWVPVFALVGEAWRIVGEVSDASLPHGANGQAWDAPVPIAVVRSARVVLVLEERESARAESLLATAEKSIDQVLAVRPSGWPGKVLVIGFNDSTVFRSYFRRTPDHAADVAALASPQFDHVVGWNERLNLTAGRVVLSPSLLSDPEYQSHAITHEFAHVAMFPVSAAALPMWLIEGFAEYVAYRQEPAPVSGVRRVLSTVEPGTGLPDDASFRTAEAGDSYVLGWLACRMIAERYGEGKLIALYEQFMRTPAQDAAVREILGIDHAALNQQVRTYIDNLRSTV